jgi:hypothetical protein
MISPTIRVAIVITNHMVLTQFIKDRFNEMNRPVVRSHNHPHAKNLRLTFVGILFDSRASKRDKTFMPLSNLNMFFLACHVKPLNQRLEV